LGVGVVSRFPWRRRELIIFADSLDGVTTEGLVPVEAWMLLERSVRLASGFWHFGRTQFSGANTMDEIIEVCCTKI
jgi:hypothetical protein